MIYKTSRWLPRCITSLIAVALVTWLGAADAQAQLPVPAPTPIKVVHIGDSYSAGNGARAADGGRNYTGVAGCYRSPTNWGSQFVDTLRELFAVTYINRACSGGVTADVFNPRVIETVRRLGSCPTAEYPDEESWVLVSSGILNTCERRLRPQIDAIDSSVDVVLMTFGGNDARFAKIVERCFVRGSRSADGCREAVEFATTRILPIKDSLYDIFVALRGKMRDDARVVFVTYPYLVPDIGYRLTSFGEVYDAGAAVRNLGDAGDAAQRAAVAQANANAGVPFVTIVDDLKDTFAGHEPAPAGASVDDPWLWESFDTILPIEWYHYQPVGHQAVAGDVVGVDLSGVGGVEDMTSDLDVAFVVDTTGSMGDEISAVRSELSSLVGQLQGTTNSFRVAVVSYRDFPARTGDPVDYPARVDLSFSNSLPTIQAAIDSLEANGGGDTPETVFSGIAAALDLPWRPGVTKVALVIGDAPALSPEPISGLTAAEVVGRSIAVDPVQVVGVNVGSLDSNGAISAVAQGTGGRVVNGTGALVQTLSDLLAEAAEQPFAWLGVSYVGTIGEPITFDASGSYDPSGARLTEYAWDFDGAGVVDLTTTVPSATTTYSEAFTGHATVKVTGPGGSALASTRVVINDTGSAPMGDSASCELDESGYSIVIDEEGRLIGCQADSLPTNDLEGVGVEFGNATCEPSCGHLGQKVMLCHVPAGNPENLQTLCIAQSAVAPHLSSHGGDYCGPCKFPGSEPLTVLMTESTTTSTTDVLSGGRARRLQTKLRLASNALARGNTRSAIRRLNSFVKSVKRLAAKGVLAEGAAVEFLQVADEILADIES